MDKANFNQAIIKPVIGGTARHIYRIDSQNIAQYNSIFAALIKNEAMMLQEFQTSICEKGEVSMVMFENNFSHAVLKKAKSGDFRVQDDFGGTLQNYIPSNDELKFAQEIIRKINPVPVYARVDILWNNNNNLALGEVELIEPELWFRRNANAAELMADTILKRYF